mgnify:CR=1 FL=1
MTRQRVISKLILIALLLTLTACTKGVGSINGTVFDAEGKPVSGAIVQIAGQSIASDENGAFSLTDVPVGQQRIIANKAAVGALTTECTIQKEITITCDLVLMASDKN